MSMGIALSGINASQKDLDTTSNNIANVNSIGFKESRAEFADVYATSIFSNASTTTGNGVKTAEVAQQFHQGSLEFTENAMDLAISGEGFFVTAEDQTTLQRNYTRAGAFKLDSENNVVNSLGEYLQGYEVNDEGVSNTVSMASTSAIKINAEVGTPTATSEVDMSLNLSSTDSDIDRGTVTFDPDDSDTYTSATSVTVYDSLGESHTAQLYFTKTDSTTNQWEVETYIEGSSVAATQTVTFDSAGSTPDITIPSNALDFGNGSDTTQLVNFNLSATQYASDFEVTALSQNGSTVGELTGIDIGDDGLVTASYSNGQTENIARVAIAQFNNNQGLSQIGDTMWQETQLSGEAIAGQANSGTFGSVNSAALEQSNVNLTEQLVNLISAQRNFQANSRSLEVESSLQQTITQIR